MHFITSQNYYVSYHACITVQLQQAQYFKTNWESHNTAMLDLDGTTALEGSLILVCAQTKRIPKSDWLLHAQLLCWVEAGIAGGLSSKEVTSNLGLTASTQRRSSVQAPVSPSRASQSILRCGQLKAQLTLQLSSYQKDPKGMLEHVGLCCIEHYSSSLIIVEHVSTSDRRRKKKREQRTLSEYLIVTVTCWVVASSTVNYAN